MSLATDCDWCALGDHSGHRSDHGIRPGLIGGTYCDCNGDCVERFQRGAAMFGDQHPTSPVSPGISEERLAEIAWLIGSAQRHDEGIDPDIAAELLAEVRRLRQQAKVARIELQTVLDIGEVPDASYAFIAKTIRALGSSHG